MIIKVTKNKVIMPKDYILNRYEYNVNPLEFEFSEEYTDDLVKKAIFANKDKAIEQVIIDNKCKIPHEVLEKNKFELRVYAYEISGDELILRYSPTYANVCVREGSYMGNTGSGEEITPTQFEQYEQALHDGIVEIENNLNISRQIKSDVEGIRDEVTEKIDGFNDNVIEKINEFNQNATTKTDGFNENAQNKTDELNEIAEGIEDMTTAIQFATFEVDDEMDLYIVQSEKLVNTNFFLNEEDGELEVEIHG